MEFESWTYIYNMVLHACMQCIASPFYLGWEATYAWSGRVHPVLGWVCEYRVARPFGTQNGICKGSMALSNSARIHHLHLRSCVFGSAPHFPLRTTLWPVAFGRLHWHLFPHRFTHGSFVTLVTLNWNIITSLWFNFWRSSYRLWVWKQWA